MATLLVLLCAQVPAAFCADGVNSYVYDTEGYIVPCPPPYVFREYLDLAYLPSGPLSAPEDIEADGQGVVYIADTGNARVIRLTPDRAASTIAHPDMTQPMGLAVDPTNGDLYIADAGSAHIFRFSPSGELLRSYPPPSSDVLPENYMYSPSNVVVDPRGWLYVTGTGTSYGIIQLDPEGTFRGFFGANRAQFDLRRAVMRLFASEEQRIRLRMQSLRPSSDVFLHADGFLYAVTESETTNQIRRLNAVGIDTYPDGLYGEMVPMKSETASEKGDYRSVDAVMRTDVTVSVPQLTKVHVDRDGIITVLDGISSKVFQYDQEGNLLFVFGGRGRVEGTFTAARGFTIDQSTGSLYVLEISQSGLHVLEQTEFAALVHQASRLYRDGQYDEALGVWAEVARQDGQYPLANAGIAKALLKMGQRSSDPRYLRASMSFYRDAGSRIGYSAAFERLRYVLSMKYFGFILGAALLAVILVLGASRALRAGRSRSRALTALSRLIGVRTVILHPFRAMEEVKHAYARVTIVSALAMLALYLGAHVLRLYVTQYHFASWDPGRVSLATELVRLLLPWFSWCITNYLVSVLFEGEGRFGQIFCASAFALAPVAALTTIVTLLSRLLSLGEAGTMTVLGVAQWVWMVLLMVLGTATVHNYPIGKSVAISALSVAGVVLLWGVAVLLLGLVGTLGNFGFTLVREVVTRAF